MGRILKGSAVSSRVTCVHLPRLVSTVPDFLYQVAKREREQVSAWCADHEQPAPAAQHSSQQRRGAAMSHHRTSQRLGAAIGVLHAAFLALLLRPAAAAGSCQKLLDRYLFEHQRDPRPYNDDSTMVYFLHVPRTAGRTFHSCMLKLGTPPTRRCPKAYDHLRLNMSVPNCYLLSSHDDYSIVSMLPDNVAVLTHLRDPVDRFLSAYEFAIEVGSRAVHRPANFRKRPDKVATDDVWPWSYLVPWFTNDVKMRVGAEIAHKQTHTHTHTHTRARARASQYISEVLTCMYMCVCVCVCVCVCRWTNSDRCLSQRQVRMCTVS